MEEEEEKRSMLTTREKLAHAPIRKGREGQGARYGRVRRKGSRVKEEVHGIYTSG